VRRQSILFCLLAAVSGFGFGSPIIGTSQNTVPGAGPSATGSFPSLSTPTITVPLLYEFDFSSTALSSPISFFYETATPTAPGTGLSDVQSSPPLSNIFPFLADRDSTGAWSFTWTTSPTFFVNWTAQTGLDFPNVPGFYPGQPSLISISAMFQTSTAPGTVNISISEVPEPGTAWLILSGVVLLAGPICCWSGWCVAGAGSGSVF
jgi:hypothetical protein